LELRYPDYPKAYLLTVFPRHMTAGFDEYDFRYERQYFALKGEDRLAVYGKAWPDVPAALASG
jgi:hypothetical protein